MTVGQIFVSIGFILINPAEGRVRGVSFTPPYPSVPAAALQDSRLYELLALVDAIRDGRAREHNFATNELTSRLTMVTA